MPEAPPPPRSSENSAAWTRPADGSVVAGRYAIEREVGRGGAGIVYRARDLQDDRIVAVKVLRSELASAVASTRFSQEVALLGRFHHPHLLPIYDSGEWDGLPFYVAPFFEGQTVRDRIERERQLPLADVLAIVAEAADALQYAHDHGVVHRDVKPENLLLSDGHVCVADFGIAYAIERAGGERLTSSQLVLGTPAYMSPEQASAERTIDGRSDQYSFACLVYEMLAGVAPFTGATHEAVIAQRFRYRPMALRAHRPDLPAHVESAVAHALSVAPADRFASISEFAAALAGTIPSVVAPEPAIRSRRPLVLLAALVVLALGISIAVSAPAMRRLFAPRVEAGAPDLHRIAIAGFAARGNGDVPEFAAALTDQLVLELGNVAALSVIAPGDLPGCASGAASCDSVLRARAAGSMARGSVQHVPGAYVAAVQFVDPATGVSHGESFDAPDSSAVRAQHALAMDIALAMRRWLGREARLAELTSGTPSTRARDLLLQADRAREDALAIADLPATEDLPTAFTSFARADSDAVLAGRADPRWIEVPLVRGWIAYDVGRLRGGAARMAAWRRGLAFADTALAIDSTSAPALELRGALRWSILSELGPAADSALVRLAEGDLRAAIARDSTRTLAWLYLSFVLTLEGHVGETERATLRAVGSDAFLEVSRQAIYLAFNNANLSRDSARAARWCSYGQQTSPGHWRFLQCQLVLMRRDALRPGSRARVDADSAWKLVAAMDRADPPEKARASGRAYFAIFRRMAAAAVSARAGQADVARAEIERAHRATAASPELQLDLLYDEGILRHALGEDDAGARLVQRLIDARPIERDLILRDPLFDWFRPHYRPPGHQTRTAPGR